MNNNEFRAMLVTETENNEFKREITTKHINDLPEGDVIINVKYSSLNYKDALSATGNKGVTRNYPHTPGIDAAGIVVQSNNDNLKIGAEVLVTGYALGMSTSGGYGQYIRVPRSGCRTSCKSFSKREYDIRYCWIHCCTISL